MFKRFFQQSIQNVLFLYSYGLDEHINIRKTIDLIFHYFCEVGTVKDIKEDGTIEYYGTPNTNKLTSDMKTRILEIAKLVIVVSR